MRHVKGGQGGLRGPEGPEDPPRVTLKKECRQLPPDDLGTILHSQNHNHMQNPFPIPHYGGVTILGFLVTCIVMKQASKQYDRRTDQLPSN
ncbi:hypothetical protein VMCG_03229 [Cytospora schulzeri]|uniref:Uncharacterized protein n=1 Tax=Cytospora schulzeri TaxID=448051 RepID=A0A423WXU9_9PEZI|nr:hypothetical protein VMCG_03229 [Valsa malicola]